jgi:hypothetical protein
MGDSKELGRDLKSDATHALVIGTKVFVSALSADGKPFVFTRDQMEFFLALQKMKAVEPAAISIGKDTDWANRFLSSKKFKAFVSAKMQELSLKNGITLEWWYQFGKILSEGKRTYYGGHCDTCQKDVEFTEYEAEAFRSDDMVIEAKCTNCETPLTIQKKTEAFKPTREQVEGWKELGSRIIPKVERVNHEFERTEIAFEVGS